MLLFIFAKYIRPEGPKMFWDTEQNLEQNKGVRVEF